MDKPPVGPLALQMKYAAKRIEEFNNTDFAAEYLREAADLIEYQDQEIERLRAIEQRAKEALGWASSDAVRHYRTVTYILEGQ